jgi:hypothetical protein
MKIESDDYYGIILSMEYHDAGKAIIDELVSSLSAQQRFDDVEDLHTYTESSYQMDTRCLVGFALNHDDYEFGVGGLCHVVGHQIVKPLRLIERLTKEMSHQMHFKIAKMLNAVQSVPNKLP